MNETAEQIGPKHSPLQESFVQANASMRNIDGRLMPEHFGDVEREYEAIRGGGSGLLDLSGRARLRVTGTEAILFLNGLITNDMKTLAENHWMPAVFPNVQGKLLAHVRVLRLEDATSQEGTTPTFLIDTEAVTHERVLQTISRFTLAGDFHVMDVTNSTACISIQGQTSMELARRVFNLSAPLSGNELREVDWADFKLTLVHATHTGEEGLDIIVDAAEANGVWQALTGEGGVAVGQNALEVLRIEAGISKFGIDMDEGLVVSEANLDDAVSFTKGCYVGQEIIARIKYRGHVAKKITGLLLDSEVDVGSKVLTADDKEVGFLSSVTFSPQLQSWIALSLIKYQYLTPDTDLLVLKNSQRVAAKVVALPFLKGSWVVQEENV
jgi:folate-binding protein YgfZ